MLVVVRVRGRDVYDVDVRVGHEGCVGAVGAGGGGGIDFGEEVLGALGGGRGCGGGEDVVDVCGGAGGGVDEEVFCECWVGGMSGREGNSGEGDVLFAMPPVAVGGVSMVNRREWYGITCLGCPSGE